MKKFILKSLELENFQIFRNARIEFNEGETFISGGNGVGKTTIASAFSWLISGKDSLGRAEFDVKRIENGQIVHKADVSVIGVFDIVSSDGGTSQMELRRVLHEDYAVKTGDYKSDQTLTYWNGVPMTITEYNKSVRETIASDEEFRMLTNLSYFLSLAANVQRPYLCKMAGVRDFKDVCSERAEWRAFFDKMTGKTLAEELKVLKEQQNRLESDFEKCQPAIEALINAKPDILNWDSLTAEKEKINAAIAEIDRNLASEEGRLNAVNEGRSRLLKQKADIEFQIMNEKQKAEAAVIIHKAQLKKQLEEKNQSRVKLVEEIATLNTRLKNAETVITITEGHLKDASSCVEMIFSAYKEENDRKFTANNECPVCSITGKICNAPDLLAYLSEDSAKAEAQFNVHHNKQLEEWMEKGRKAVEHETQMKAQLKEQLAAKDVLQQAIDNDNKVLASMPDYTAVEPQFRNEDVPGYMESLNRRIQLEQDLKKATAAAESFAVPQSDNSAVSAQKAELNRQLEEVIDMLSDKKQIEKIDAQITAKEVEAKQLACKINDCKTRISTIQDIDRFIVEDATDRVNKLFKFVKWQMFRPLKKGGYEECCLATINGVSASVNTAARINIGIDIANTFSQQIGVMLPCFIDGRESVNNIIDTDLQIINLCVAPEGTALTIK